MQKVGLQYQSSSSKEFNHLKGTSILGLSLGLLLMVFGFMVVGGEWFFMWQSEKWHVGLDAALRVATVAGISLLFLNQPD